MRGSFTEAIDVIPAGRRTTGRLRRAVGAAVGVAARSVKGAGTSRRPRRRASASDQDDQQPVQQDQWSRPAARQAVHDKVAESGGPTITLLRSSSLTWPDMEAM